MTDPSYYNEDVEPTFFDYVFSVVGVVVSIASLLLLIG